MTLFASLNGIPIVRGRVVIPYTGIWHGDIWLDRVADTSGSQALQVDALAGPCAVVRQVDFTGQSMLRIVGGAGGWRQQATPKLYANANLSTILSDTATLVGEQVNVTSDSAVTPFFVVTSEDDSGNAMPASQVLQELLGAQWYMDLAGVIQQGPRPSPAIASTFTIAEVDGPPGIYTVESDNIADWLPGATFASPTGQGTISRVEHIIDAGKLATRVMVTAPATTASDRLRVAFEALLRQYLPGLLFLAEWEYTVVSVGGTPPAVTIDAKCVDPRLPDISGVPLRPSAGGVTATPVIGAHVIVGFVNGDPRNPEVRSLDPKTSPTNVFLGGVGPFVARLGDSVLIYFPPSMQFSAIMNPDTAPVPIVGTMLIPSPGIGTIQDSSAIVQCP